MIVQTKIIIAILTVVAVIAAGAVIVVKVVHDDKATAQPAVQSVPPPAPNGGRGQPRGEITNSPAKEY